MTTPDYAGTGESAMFFPKKKKGEPHRIYWQQWTSMTRQYPNDNNGTGDPTIHTSTHHGTTTTTSWVNDNTDASSLHQQQQFKNFNRRELIMSSVAIRLSRSAKVKDVTTLLRQTIQLPHLPNNDVSTLDEVTDSDCLVLVGTIYTIHKGFIQYQHSLPPSPHSSETKTATATTIGVEEPPVLVYDEPYHIVYTLSANENPLLAHGQMEQYLIRFWDRYRKMFAHVVNDTAPTATNNMAPKIQWYYLPAVTTNSDQTNAGTLIPNCVELDGYCTYMEDDAIDDYFDTDKRRIDNQTGRTDHPTESTNAAPLSLRSNDETASSRTLFSTFPWILSSTESSPSSSLEKAVPKQFSKNVQRMLQYEECMYNELCWAESQTPPHACITGYLLYRNTPHDRNAWTRMYCTLTNHDFWFVSRIYSRVDRHRDPGHHHHQNNTANSEENMATGQTYRYVRHGRIRLTRAILIQPTPTTDPSLFRIPYSFEIVASDGTSYVFRTGSKYQQTMWTTSISERIISSFESSLFENAQLIMTEACYARNRRATQVAVEPLWDQTIRVMMVQLELRQPSIGNSIGSVLRFGMDVSTYKDRCRFVRSTMPTRTPMVVAESVTPAQFIRRRFFSSSSSTSTGSQLQESSSSNDVVKYEPFAAHIQSMIRITWESATALLARARSLALTLHVRSSIRHRHEKDTEAHQQQPSLAEIAKSHGSSPRPIRLSHGVDTLCRHVELVLTGRLDIRSSPSVSLPIADHGTSAANLQQQEDGPPPDDLFDHLLSELQSLAALADYYHFHQKPKLDNEPASR